MKLLLLASLVAFATPVEAQESEFRSAETNASLQAYHDCTSQNALRLEPANEPIEATWEVIDAMCAEEKLSFNMNILGDAQRAFPERSTEDIVEIAAWFRERYSGMVEDDVKAQMFEARAARNSGRSE
ncbi:MAG: hypothetical protein JY451_07815 [Erythrobacter sp.]|nr:MAG: hypothetical protein JY451_07815 [Erythrobacter sp.]